MKAAVAIDSLGKQFRIGARAARYQTLRETIADGVGVGVRRLAAGVRGNARRRDDEVIWALRDVSLEIPAGEVLGIIGRNGAGKSTLLKILSRIMKPTTGRAVVRGRAGALLEVGAGFHGELSGRENVLLNGAILGMKRSEIARRFDEIVAFSGVEQFIDTPVKRYSTGMYLRLAFAVAAHLEPDILFVDEVLAVGDLAFQQKCMQKMDAVSHEGRTVVLVSHNMTAILSLCTRVIVLDGGRVQADGPASTVVEEYRTRALSELSAAETEAGVWENLRPAGNAHIVIDRLEMIDPRTGDRKPHLTMGDAVTFRMHFHASADCDSASFEIILQTQDALPLVGARTDADRVRTRVTAGQRGSIDCTFASLPLAANRSERYLFYLHVYDAMTGHTIFDGSNFGQFSVLPRDVEGRRYPLTTGASYIDAEHHWDLSGFVSS